MMRPLRTVNNVSSIQLFNLIRFGVTILISILLAKSGLSTAEISMYEALLFLGNLVSFFWIGGGLNALLSFYPKLEERDRAAAFGQAFVVFSALGIAAASLLWVLRDFLLWRLTNFTELPYFGWLCLFVVLNAPSFLVHIYYLLLRKFDRIVWFGAISFGLQLIAVLVPVYAGWGLRWTFIGLTFWAALKLIWVAWILVHHASFRFRKELWQPYAALFVPLTAHLLIGNSVEYTDGLIVTSYFTDERAFAIFRYGARELPLTTLLVGGLVTALIPEIATDLAGGMKQVRERTAQLAAWLFPLSALFMLLSPFAFPLVYNDDFALSARVFNVYLLILSSRILLPQVIVIGQGKNYFLVVSALIETVVNIALSLWWVRWLGLEGIALASLVAFSVNKANLIAFNYWKLGISPGEYLPWKKLLWLNLLLAAAYFASLYLS